MSVLFFFPWIASHGAMQLGELSLIPYEHGKAPGTIYGVSQEIIDAVLENYGDVAFTPSLNAFTNVRKATLITWADDADGLDLPESQIFVRLEQARYIAFSALAQRRFCSHGGYCNADGYQIIAQGFVAERPGSISITTRRRDGFTRTYISRTSSPRFIRPEHVNSSLHLEIDETLARALLELPLGNLKNRIDDAIEKYLLANTDSASMPPHAELVLMRSAFETLLGASYNKNDLCNKFIEHFRGELPNPPKWGNGVFTEACWRKRWPKTTRPLNAWVEDFCDARNSAAHGARANGQSSIWQSQNHLLFSAWLFPLMVKKVLVDVGLYQLSDEDLAARKGCEAFLAHDLLSPNHEDTNECWWNHVERELSLSQLAATLTSLVDPQGKK
ncbi:hypothetical protein [Pseudomonas sp. OV226]|uniref:hypothetical protein n=1 Tax=Pseudomonas sp. OV226 TaxID=2135588 RepID=UPI000D6BB714|nr:hypothetical protein [Pseudomonas sp. OV226]PWK32577.1 hypothetical protein C7534_120127 [Pseudomonas sp. OV226]